MHVEDSYEGALLRLQRLEEAGLVLAPPAPSETEDENDEDLRLRMAELEQLATLACEDNERLKSELAEARDLIVALERHIAVLEIRAERPEPAPVLEPPAYAPPAAPEQQAEAQQPYAQQPYAQQPYAQQPYAQQAYAQQAYAQQPTSDPTVDPAVDPAFGLDGFDALDSDPSLSLVPRRSGALRLVFAIGAIALLAIGVIAMHPWQRPTYAPVVVAPPAAPVAAPTPPAPAPVAAAPATATPVPAPAPSTPPTTTQIPSVTTHHASHHRHHAAHKSHHASHHAAGKHWSDTSDPIGGLDL